VPRKPTYKPVKRGPAQPAVTRGRRSAGMIAVPTILVGALLMSGCTSPTASPQDGTLIDVSATAVPETELETPAVTEPQAKRIVSRVAAAIAEADETKDPVLAATRLDGPALQLRTTNYAVRKVVADYAAPVAIPASTVEITLPQQNDSWPRTVLAVVQDADPTIAPQALVLIQDDPRAQYKVHYAVALAPGTVFPKVPPASIGTSRVAPDSKLFSVVPADIAAAYGDTLLLDVESESWELFATEGDTLRAGVGKAAQDARKAGTPSTAQLIFDNAPGEGQIVVLVTNDGGAIVATELAESETIQLLEVGAAANAQPDVAALLGKISSTRGITANYGDQLLFYVPPAGSEDPIVLLGYAQGLISAVELP
jgi:hypothetical protein